MQFAHGGKISTEDDGKAPRQVTVHSAVQYLIMKVRECSSKKMQQFSISRQFFSFFLI